YPGEKLDMGSSGVYTIKSGDSINKLTGNPFSKIILKDLNDGNVYLIGKSNNICYLYPTWEVA
ncbi:MAG: hypothetical protein K0U38_09820, partial [Epsilonproteobacteria bacterium]|nr:hypothetical protein [Campylobacterota bacterium]